MKNLEKKRLKCPNQDQVNYASLVRTSSDKTQIFFSVSKERFQNMALVLLSPALLIQVLGPLVKKRHHK